MSKEIENGSPVSIGNIALSTDSGTATLANVQFFNELGDTISPRASGAAVDLTVTTTPKTIAELWQEATGGDEIFAARFANVQQCVGIFTDNVAGADVNVFVNSNVAAVVNKVIPIGEPLAWGILPPEIWNYGGVIINGSSSSSSTMLAKRKDSAGSLALADGDMAPLQMDADGNLRGRVIGPGVVGLGAENNPGFPVGGRAANAERSPVDHTSYVSFTTSLNGRQVVLPHALPVQTWNAPLEFTSGGSHASTAAKAAGGAGKRHYVTSISVIDSDGAAKPTPYYVEIKDGSTRMWVLTVGQTMNFDPPLRFSDNTAVNVDPSGAAGAIVNVAGYTAGE